jgi:hypothetical protein
MFFLLFLHDDGRIRIRNRSGFAMPKKQKLTDPGPVPYESDGVCDLWSTKPPGLYFEPPVLCREKHLCMSLIRVFLTDGYGSGLVWTGSATERGGEEFYIIHHIIELRIS